MVSTELNLGENLFGIQEISKENHPNELQR